MPGEGRYPSNRDLARMFQSRPSGTSSNLRRLPGGFNSGPNQGPQGRSVAQGRGLQSLRRAMNRMSGRNQGRNWGSRARPAPIRMRSRPRQMGRNWPQY